MIRTVAAFAMALAALAVAPARAQDKPIELIVFPGGFNWPIWVAQDKGLFAANKVAVKITPTPNSVFQLTNLIDGKFDIAMTAIDNLIAYDEGQGEAPVSIQPDLIAFMGGDSGFLSLVTVPEVKTYADLKGKELSVDARTTGYAFVLEKMLQKSGLKDSDYSLVKAGGVLQRFEALMAKKHAGTLLLSPFEVPAQAKGFTLLGYALDVLGRYQGLVGGTRRGWAKDHEAELVGYIRAYVAAVDWLYGEANKVEAVAILRKNLPNMSPELADKAHAILLDPKSGFQRKARIDVEGVRTALALRSEYGEPKKALTDPAKYYDPTWYDKATR
ncbi:MAG: ABC transporter substrate-binding protein [Proteobacteria bacterium]|nr:ABC transporter substrate-binding protein [Pseudomonadota bacterium]